MSVVCLLYFDSLMMYSVIMIFIINYNCLGLCENIKSSYETDINYRVVESVGENDLEGGRMI